MEFDTDKNKIVLGLPYLSIDGGFFNSILSVIASHIAYGWACIGGTLLPEARNKAIALAYENQPDFTHLVFIDSDMGGFGPQHVVKLVNNNLGVVSALVCQRKPPFNLVLDFGEEKNGAEYIIGQIKQKSVLKSKIVGMAFTCLSREVLDMTREETDTGPAWFFTDREPRDSFEEERANYIDHQAKHYIKNKNSHIEDYLEGAIAFGQASHVGSKPLSEDISFSRKCKKLGIDLFVDMGVSVGHIGEDARDFRDSLKEEPQLKLVEA